MGKINVLSFEIANLIAAGEVVERPSSVLKELIENSIDAGSTEIVAEIKRGGVSLIRVTDNGCGIEKEDLPVSLKRHATSKISNRDDLNSIMTLGFRGEALAAISSVSELTIITRTHDSEYGHMLTSEGGRIVDISEVGSAVGTTIVVENLFFNVPARRKFLKKDATEAMNVSALVEKVALSRPDISIQLLIDGEEKFKTPGDGDLLHAIRAVFGREFASKLIKVYGVTDGITVSGYIGRSDNVRKSRNLENIFINGRYVKSLTAQAAIEKAYTSFIATEHFPTCALFIEMHPGAVDVNVHPAKLEVKFSDERKIFEAVYFTVKNALEESEYRPEMTLQNPKKTDYNPIGAFVPIGEDTKGKQISFASNDSFQVKRSSSENTSVSYGRSQPSQNERRFDLDTPRSVASNVHLRESNSATLNSQTLTPRESRDVLSKYKSAPIPVSEAQNSTESQTIKHEYKYVGEAFNCYVMIELENELLIIDKHAAHERIIFEDLKRGRNLDKRVGSQSLILPITVILTSDESAMAMEKKADFEALGFEFNSNEKSVDITSIPDNVSPSDAEDLFVSILGDLTDGKGTVCANNEIRLETALYSIACKAAIKGGRNYDRAIIDWLINKVLDLPDITVCPHGRPIAYKLKKTEIDRQFDRIK